MKEISNNREWQNYQNIVVELLKKAKNKGATEAEASLHFQTGLSATVRMRAVDTIEFNRDKSLTLTVYKGKRKASVSTSDFQESALESAVDAACNIAEFTEEDPCSGLAERESLAHNIPDLDLYYPLEISSEEAVLRAQECEAVALDFDPRIKNSEGTTFSTHSHFMVYGNSLGFLGAYPSSLHSLNSAVIAEEGGLMQRDSDYTIARDGNELDAARKVGLSAAERTLKRLQARKIKTEIVPVIYAAELATGLLSHFLAAISGSNLYRKASFLLDHLGKPIFPDFVKIAETPHLKKGLGSAPFDAEGVATANREIVEAGLLKSYVLSTYSARKLGLKTTGNAGGVHNVQITPSAGKKDLKALCKEMHRGLLVTDLMGHGINLVTGDYSRGAFGYWVENGEIAYPVQEITVAGNLKDVYRNLVAVGADIDHRSSLLTGSWLLDKMTVGGV